MLKNGQIATKEFLLLSDFDQTLSLQDSGDVLSEALNIPNFGEKVSTLAAKHLVQQGGELAYLLVHDPDFSRVRAGDLRAAGKKVQLKANIPLLVELLENLEGYRFTPYVVSAGPQEIVESALEGIIPPEQIFASRLTYNGGGEISDVECLRTGYGKVAILDQLRERSAVSQHRLVYVGDGSSDVHVMLHVNRLEGLTVAVSENKYLTQIAKRTESLRVFRWPFGLSDGTSGSSRVAEWRYSLQPAGCCRVAPANWRWLIRSTSARSCWVTGLVNPTESKLRHRPPGWRILALAWSSEYRQMISGETRMKATTSI